jgi:hypothetical protein
VITHQAAEVISDDYRHGVISAIKSVHWSVPFGAAISWGAAGAYAKAQHAAGESIQVRARLISKVMGTIAFADADGEHDEYTRYCT